LTAPFAGVIAAVNIQANAQPPAGQPAISIVDDTAFYVDVTIDETDIGKVQVAMPVSVTLDAYPDINLTGVIESIAPAATTAGGVIAYPVRVRLHPTTAAAVRDGMTASIVVRTDFITDVLLAPNWAVRTDQASGEIYAYIMQNAMPQRVTLTLGKRSDTAVEISSGLTESDTVVLLVEERNLLMGEEPPASQRAEMRQ